MGRLMLLFFVIAPMVLVSHAGNFPNSYTMKISKDGKDFNEQIAVDTKKNTEYSQVTEASTGRDAGDTMHDFNRKLTMTRAPDQKACFLRESIEDAPRPAELLQLLRLVSKYASLKINPQNQGTYKVVGNFTDRSGLSQEMADMCADRPIYRVVKGAPDQNDTADQMNNAERPLAEKPRGPKQRRGICREVCRVICSVSCSWRGCSRSCRRVCNWVC